MRQHFTLLKISDRISEKILIYLSIRACLETKWSCISLFVLVSCLNQASSLIGRSGPAGTVSETWNDLIGQKKVVGWNHSMANGHPFFSSFQLTKEALFDNDLTTGQNWPKNVQIHFGDFRSML